MTEMMIDVQNKELDRMCGNLLDFAGRDISEQIELITTEGERHSVWNNAREFAVAHQTLAHAGKMYALLGRILFNRDIHMSIDEIVKLLDLAKPDFEATPDMDAGDCERCGSPLTADDMSNCECHICGTVVEFD